MTLSDNTLTTKISIELNMSVPPLAQIRHWLATVLADLAEELLQDLLLVCTELVSNAYDHAGAPRRLRVHPTPDYRALRVEVDDGSPDLLPVAGTSRLNGFRGRGLVMVDSLSCRRWGTRVHDDGKTVWAELALA
ncbi:ATP-binding protein [Actinosynnema sp. NPDC059335]|uniref:ATP-binding protein n=1 Tax=Actinosynnema sp. NPDC059335 TaxID=3346804 RepID=UPI00366E406C